MDTRLILFALSFLPAVLTTTVVTDGNWSPWSNVTSCSTTCADGYIIRNRTCDNPPPANGGANCTGQSTDKVLCNEGNCPSIDGSWGPWGNSSACSKTCGDGEIVRNRSCDSPAPENGGYDCNGSNSDINTCNEGVCPVINGSWGEWTNYSDCTVSCDGGFQTRFRLCNSPSPENGGLDCNGSSSQTRPCKTEDCPGMDNKGKTFVLGFMPNYDLTAELKIFITTDSENDVRVDITTPLFNPSFSDSLIVRKGTVEKVSIDQLIVGSPGKIGKKGISVSADDDIIVYAINKRHASTDAFLVLPVDALGQEYYVVSWQMASSFMIVGTDDNTEVKIKFGKECQSVMVNGIPFGPRATLTIFMNKFETFFMTSNAGDFTGTHIFSNKPVVLLGGSVCARIVQGACDHLVQQMLPIEKWGKEFVTIGMPNCKSPDTYRIVASQDNTVVNISGINPVNLPEPGDFFTFNLNDNSSKTVSSNKHIALTLFTNGFCKGDLGDPAMILVPPIQQYSSDYTFSTVSLDGNDFINSVVLVISDNFKSGLRFDNKILPATTWNGVEGRSDIKYTEFIISSGAHSVFHINPMVTFLAVSTGIQYANSYGYPAGLNFRSTVQDCNKGAENNTGAGGSSCDLGLDPCKDVHCLNNGTCSPLGWTGFECKCQMPFDGPVCEIDMCKPYPSDVVFVIDNSRSMGSVYFELQKEYLINLTKDWIIDEEHFQIAIVSFSDASVVQYNFGIISNDTDFWDKLSNIEFKGSISQLHLGIAKGEHLLSKRDRRIHFMKAKKYLIVISDGLLSTPRELQEVTSEDITTDIVAFGEDVSHYYLSKITGNMSDVFPPISDRLWYHMMIDLIHPVCNVCHESNETDVLIAVDVSRDMDTTDLTTVIPSLMNKLLNNIGLENADLRLSMVNFASQVDVRFTNQTYSNDTQSRTVQRMSYFSRENTKVSNFSDILGHVVNLSNDTDSGARLSAQKDNFIHFGIQIYR
ncbi:HMCN [Mytilus coruscus]|uniref:HMCN n=1 Tax=Mytilus coruscus TaxID=42192 RepID=A0A6J8CU61_MYTCO|nr:HMCN [Mytilus coruscus]